MTFPLAAAFITERERDDMTYKKKPEKTVYPLHLDTETYETVVFLAENMKPEVSRASILREAIRLGLNLLKEKHDQAQN